MQGFGEINEFLKSYVKSLYGISGFELGKYIEKMDVIYEIGTKSYLEGTQYFKNIESVLLPSKKITIEETLSLVFTYFKTIDSSFVKKLEQACRSGIIHFTRQDDLEKLDYNETNYYLFENLAGIFNSNYLINIVLEETIADAFTLVHEFSHYKNISIKEEYSLGYLLFTEGYAHMFETDFYLYLLNTNWKREASIYYQGLLLSLLNRTSTYIREYSILDTFLTYQKITNKSIYRACKEYANPKNGIKMQLETINEVLEKLNKPSYYFLEDIPYVLGLSFSKEVRKQFLQDKELFLEEYETLENRDKEYYYKKYIKGSSLENLYQLPRK